LERNTGGEWSQGKARKWEIANSRNSVNVKKKVEMKRFYQRTNKKREKRRNCSIKRREATDDHDKARDANTLDEKKITKTET